MQTIVVNRISLVLVSLFCCHGLTDGMVLKGRKIEENPDFFVVSVESKLMPIDYLFSFFNPPIKMLEIPNKLLDHKFKINKSTVAPLILYETSTQIPDPNDGKRIIRQANTADGLLTKASSTKSPHDVYNTMNSTAENSTEIIDHVIKPSVFHDLAPYVAVKKYSTGMIDTISNGFSNCTSYILMIKKRNMYLIPTISACALIGAFVGILLFVAVRANQLRNARREADLQMPENIGMYMV